VGVRPTRHAVSAYTDHIFADTNACDDPGPGDIVLYEYADSQGCRFPHVGFYIDENQTLDCRGGVGVGYHPHVVGAGRVYRRVPGVLDNVHPIQEQRKMEGLITAIAYMGDNVADQIEQTRASLDDGVERPHPDMPCEELRRNLEQVFTNIDRVYQELGGEGQRLRDTRVQFVGPRP